MLKILNMFAFVVGSRGNLRGWKI